MKFKYITTGEGALIFNDNIVHSDAAEGLGEVLSAGFVLLEYHKNKVECHPFGESFSLGIASKEGDKELLDSLFNRNF